jgi:putative RecB family exonuclease
VTGSAPGQSALPGMPRRLLTVTPSRVDSWLTCPRRYRFSYVDRPRPPRGPTFAHQTVGALAHGALLRYFGDLEPEDRRPERAADLVRESWPDTAASRGAGFRDAEQSRRWQETVAGWVRDYGASAPADLRPRALERVVAFTSPTARFEGRLDRVDQRDDAAVVVDYNTGRSTPTDAEARSSAALALYAVGVNRVLRLNCTRVELHHLPTGTVAAADHDSGSLQQHLDRLADAAADAEAATVAVAADAGLADSAFPARPGPLCGWCDYRAACPEGSAAAAPVEPWAGLADY